MKALQKGWLLTNNGAIMKQIAKLFLILGLIATWQLSGHEAGQIATQIVTQQQSSSLNDNDDYVLLECRLSSFERKSKSNSHLYHLHADRANTTITRSLNWSGYSAFTGTHANPNPTYDTVTGAAGTWKVPHVTASAGGDTYSAAWVGIDGFVNSTVEQIGTEHDVISGIPTYFAWFELFPADSQLIEGFPVDPGDKIEAQVTSKGLDAATNNLFRLVIKNHTKRVKFVVYQSTLPGNPAHLSSANWIVEAPATSLPANCIGILPLANFGTIFFEDCQAIINGRTGPIRDKHWTFTAITMVTTGGVVKDIPSGLTCDSDSSSSGKKKSRCKKNAFSVLWQNTGPFPNDPLCPI